MSGTAAPDYGTDFNAAGAAYNVDPTLLRSVFNVESGGNWNTPNSKAGAIGGMQIMPATAQSLGIDPRDPVQSIWGAAKLIDQNLRQYGTPERALMAYNGGNESRWNNPETQAYPGKVLAAYRGLSAPAQATGTQRPYQIAAANTGTASDAAPSPMAPPGAAPAGNGQGSSDDISSMTWAQFRAAATRGAAPTAPAAAPAAAPATPAAPPAGNDPDDISSMTWAQFRAAVTRGAAPTPQGTQAPTSTPAPAPAGAVPPPPHIQIGMTPQEGAAMTAGEGQGLRDIGLTANRGAQWAANNVPLVGRAFNALGYDPTSEVNRLTAERGQFDQSYVGNPVATTGRVGTQIAASLPVMGGANALLAGAGRGIVAGVNAISPEAAAAFESGIGTVGRAIGGGAGAPTAVSAGSLPARVASQATAGALQGGETAAITSGQSDKPIGQQIAQGAATGAAMGAAIPAAQAASNAVSGATSSLSPETAQLAKLARDKYGIQLKAPQLGTSPTLSYANSALKVVPGSGAGAENAAVQGQWQHAVAQTFGENADKITPEVISRAQTRIGGVLNSVENNASIHLDNQFVNDAATIEANARSSLPDSEFGVVSRQLDNIMKNLQPGDTITGTTYGNLIHKGSPLDAALNSSDANISNYAGQIKEALRDSLTRSLPADEAQAYQTARTQYKSLKTVEPLTIRADTVGGARPSSGDISPAALRAAVNKSYGTSVAQAEPGQVPLNDLARIGQLMKEPPSSGTAERSSMLYAGLKAAELGGALLGGGHYAGIVPAATTLGAGVVGGRLAGAYLRSNALANRMIESSVNPLAYAGNPLLRRFAPPVAAVIGGQFNPLSVGGQFNPLSAAR